MSMMKGFSNAFRIPELRKKILITLGLVFVCRLVSQIPTPGVDWTALKSAIDNLRANNAAGGGLLDWFDVFTGGALGQCAIGFLSIWPYISAQIVIQLLGSVIPSLEKLKKEGESGRWRCRGPSRWTTATPSRRSASGRTAGPTRTPSCASRRPSTRAPAGGRE